MPRKFHALKRPKARQDWSKWNLYNLSRVSTPPAANKTFFQQKWLAKSMTRAYHNPHVREGQWTRMFDRRLPAVVPMDYKYLARSDGSEHAAGRGSGLEVEEDDGTASGPGGRRRERRIEKTPYMHMAFHPLERRLDTAIWRAMFASSTKQARQFVVHGSVKVNGKKMIYPGYLLNPGDMFSVEPERVMFATGARKSRKDKPTSTQKWLRVDSTEQTATPRKKKGESEEDAAETAKDKDAPEEQTDPKKALKQLMVRARTILEGAKTDLSAKRLQELRQFARSVRKTLSKHGSNLEEGEEKVTDLEKALSDITAKIPAEEIPKEAAPSTDASTPVPANPQSANTDAYVAKKDAELLHAALAKARENPIDTSKPYATPWQPREYMSAFAFIPRYLEVNQSICSAVYLRHPVARPGLAEVPTPFHSETLGLAFNWYLRRR